MMGRLTNGWSQGESGRLAEQGLGRGTPGSRDRVGMVLSLHNCCFRLRLLASGFQQCEIHPLPKLK